MVMFRLPPFNRRILSNGMTLLTLRRPGLPLVSLRFALKTGSLGDPRGQEGLASLTAETLRRGTRRYTANEFANALDSRGGALAADTDLESTYVAAEFMRRDLEAGLDLMAEILRSPTFPADEVGKRARRRSDSLRQAKDNPQAVAQLYYQSFLFGEHPYGRSVWGDEQSSLSIDHDAVCGFWEACYAPQNLILSVVGDFEDSRLETRLQDRFGDWNRVAVSRDETPEPVTPAQSRVLLVDKPDANQTYFRFGSLGIERRNEDYVHVQVINTIFGGRFTSWLNSALRINAGLTYSVRSFFSAMHRRGAFTVASYTPTENTCKAIDLALEQLRRLHEQGIQEEELASVKRYIRGQFPPTLETNDQLADTVCELELFDLDASYIDSYLDKVEALTVEKARELIRRHFPADNLTFTLIGEAAKLRDSASAYGPVTELPISRPGFG